MDRRRQQAVVRPEVVSPRGDAVRLVDDHPAYSQPGQLVHELWPPKPFGCHEQQPVFARDRPAQPIDLLGPVDRRVDEGRGHVQLCEAVDLVLHQRDEWRDHQGQTAVDDRRHPVTDALPRAGWCDRKDVTTRQHRFNHLCLPKAESLEAEDVAQHELGSSVHPRSLTESETRASALYNALSSPPGRSR